MPSLPLLIRSSEANHICELPGRSAIDLKDVPLDILSAAARAQGAKYARGEVSGDAAGVELFRRAIAEGDDAAWCAVISVYRGLLVAQAGRQLVRKLVDEDDGFCVDRAFERFWRATRARNAQHFEDLASILKYLKMCLASVLLDEARVRRRRAYVPLDDVPEDARVSADPTASAVEHIAHRELWQAIDDELHDEGERLVARLSFVAWLSPREIQARHPDRFADVATVYRVKRNLMERLRRCRALRQLVESD
jgi:hypothetical protein